MEPTSLSVEYNSNLSAVQVAYPALKWLWLANICLTEIPSEFIKLFPRVRRVNLITCELDVIPDFPSAKEYLIICTQFSYEQVIPAQVRKLELYKCTNLRKLMSELPTGLNYLDVSDHYIRFIPDLSYLHELRVLSLSHCNGLINLPKLPEGLLNLDLSRCLSLKYTSLQELPISLRKLNLKGTFILDWQAMELASSLPNLRKLVLSSGKLVQL